MSTQISPAEPGETRPRLRVVLAVAGGVWLGVSAGAVLLHLPLAYVGVTFLFAFIALALAILPAQGELARSRRAMRRAHWRHHILTGMGYEKLRLDAWDEYISAYKDVARQESNRRFQRLSSSFR